jgi:hypothetical protein
MSTTEQAGRPHEVRDGKDGATRVIKFNGQKIAEVSSRRAGNPRWTELHLYRTDGGKYVLEKVGASVVLHSPSCPEMFGNLPRFQDTYPGADPGNGKWWFCDRCGEQAVRDITSLLVEQTRYWATVTEDPAQVVDALYRRKDGAKSMPRVSLDLLEEAGRNDPAILEASTTEYVL